MNAIEKMVNGLDPQTKKFVLEDKDFEQQVCEIQDDLQRYLDMVNPTFGHRTDKKCFVADALFCAITTLISDADRVLEK